MFDDAFFDAAFFDAVYVPRSGGFIMPRFVETKPSAADDDDDIFLLWFALLSRNG